MDPDVALQASASNPASTILKVVTNDKSRCKYNITNDKASFNEAALDFDNMTSFDGFDLADFSTQNNQDITINSLNPDAIQTITFYVVCQNKAERLSLVRPTDFKINPATALEITSDMGDFYFTSDVDLEVRTNLKTQCRLKDEGFFSSSTTMHIKSDFPLFSDGEYT